MFKNFNFKILGVAICLLTFFSNPVQAKADVNVVINGEYLEENLSEIKNDKTFIPIRFISEKLGAEVEYKDENKEVIIVKDEQSINLFIGQKRALINGKEITLEDIPYIKDDRTLVPLRFVAENFNEIVNWNSRSKTAIIGDSNAQDVPNSINLPIKVLYGNIKINKDWEDDIILSCDYATEGDILVLSKKLQNYYETNNIDKLPVLFIVENTDKPLLSTNGLTLEYDSTIERFVLLSYSSNPMWPEDIKEEIEEEKAKYIESFKTFKFKENLQDKIEGMKPLLYTDENMEYINTVDKIKSLIAPWYYFENTIPYIKFDEDSTFVYLPNYDDEGNPVSKIELDFVDKELTRYHLKFYQPAEKLASSNFVKDYAEREINFFMESILNYRKDQLPKLELEPDGIPSLYEKGKHEVFKDSNGTRYVFDMTLGYLEYMKK